MARQVEVTAALKRHRPEMVADVLAGRPLDRRLICRTFSDCTTAPRKGFVSGCYPLDPFYRARPEAGALSEMKRGAKNASRKE